MSDVRIPEWRLREITADPDKAVVTVGEVRLMAAELLERRKADAALSESIAAYCSIDKNNW